MSGINEYFNGKFLSRGTRNVIALTVAVSISCVGALYVIYYSDQSDNVGPPSLRSPLDRLVLDSHANIILIHGLILIEGFLERNIIQVVLASLINAIFFSSMIADRIIYMEAGFEYVYVAVYCCSLLFNLYLLYWGFTLRQEFGWFYYKSYGSNWEENVICSIRKTQSVLGRLLLQDVVSFWLLRSDVASQLLGLHYAVTALYYALLLLYLVEGSYESYLLRLTSITISLLLTANAVVGTVLIATAHAFVEADEAVEPISLISITLLINSAVRSVVQLGYTAILILDFCSLHKGFRGYYKIRQKKRISIS